DDQLNAVLLGTLVRAHNAVHTVSITEHSGGKAVRMTRIHVFFGRAGAFEKAVVALGPERNIGLWGNTCVHFDGTERRCDRRTTLPLYICSAMLASLDPEVRGQHGTRATRRILYAELRYSDAASAVRGKGKALRACIDTRAF